MARRLAAIEGQFVLSINDTPRMRAAFAGFVIQETAVSYASHHPGRRRPTGAELIVASPIGD